MKKLLLFIGFSFMTFLVFAQGWQRILTDENITLSNACNDNKGGFMLLCRTNAGNSTYKVINIDSKGLIKWTKSYTEAGIFGNTDAFNIIESPDGHFLICKVVDSFGPKEFSMIKIDKNGSVLWSKNYKTKNVVIKTSKKEYIITGISDSLSSTVMQRLDLNGNILSTTKFNYDPPIDFLIETDGILFIGNNYYINRLSFNGVLNTLNYNIYGSRVFSSFSRILKDKYDNIYVNTIDEVYKTNPSGRLMWFQRITNLFVNFIWLANDNNLVCVVPNNNLVNGKSSLQLIKLKSDGLQEWTKQYSFTGTTHISSVIKAQDGGYLISGYWYISDIFNPIFHPLLIKTDENGSDYANFIQGKVYRDMDRNCTSSTGDLPCETCLVVAENKAGESFKITTNQEGFFSMNLDTGAYTLKTSQPLVQNYWDNCVVSTTVSLKADSAQQTNNFFIKPTVNAPAMQVNIATNFLRRCFNNTYSVEYCNKGTVAAKNAYIEVSLDPLLEYIGASRPLTSINGNKYRFNLDIVDIGDCGRFNIETKVKCNDSTRLGLTLCTSAKIYPDTVVNISPLWNGASIEVSANCIKDSVEFQVKNTGKTTSSTLNGYVIENDVLRFKRSIKLPVNGVFTEKVLGNKNTWRMTVDQEFNHPTSSNPTAFVEGCGTGNAALRDNFATQFANDDKILSYDMDCQPIIGSFDPNDKIGYPSGYNIQHFVPQNQDIDYKIRFQNTGTDTAFTVVIRDTLSDKLDISSIEFGTSSHPYKAEIYGKNILKFTFININLVDSFKNERLSHGFVQFRVKQNKDLSFGTKIFNSAGIYFDFNDPVITNTTLHTVGSNALLSTIFENNINQINVKLSPNPFIEKAVFEFPSNISGLFQLLDLNGRVIRTEKIDGSHYQFERKEIGAGIYIFKILKDDTPLSIGKLVIQN